jgi:alkylation response protein AidB-like acyl-CoA dehydrogenase
MDFALTPEQERFREELRAFFAEDRVRKSLDEARHAVPGEEPAALLDIYRWLGERGWLAINWPPEYGGLGKTAVEAGLVTEEMALHGVPDLVHVLSVDIVGLFVLLAGTPEQKRRFLPPLARGEMTASVLYTEPAVGSDLSALRTSAEPDGDGWRLRGRKVFNMTSGFADYALTAARTRLTQSKTEGITLFMVPLRAEGVEVLPMPSILDDPFDDVRLNGVRVTRDDVIGPLHQGWQIINAALALERTGMDYAPRVRRWLDTVIARARETGRLLDPEIGGRIADLDARVRAGRLLALRVMSNLARGEIDEVASAMSKWWSTELGREVARLALDVGGLEVLLSSMDDEAPAAGLLEAIYREAPTLTISAGTSEIMLYLIATNGLGIYQD